LQLALDYLFSCKKHAKKYSLTFFKLKYSSIIFEKKKGQSGKTRSTLFKRESYAKYR